MPQMLITRDAGCTHWGMDENGDCKRCGKNAIKELEGWWESKTYSNYHLPSTHLGAASGSFITLCGVGTAIRPVEVSKIKLKSYGTGSYIRRWLPHGYICSQCWWVDKLLKEALSKYKIIDNRVLADQNAFWPKPR